MLGQQCLLAESRVNDFRRGVVNVNIANAKTAGQKRVFPQGIIRCISDPTKLSGHQVVLNLYFYCCYTSIWQRQSDDTRDAQW